MLVLEDLRGLTAADQVHGASPRQVKRAVRAAASLHGKYWNRVELLTGSGFEETLAPRVWMRLQVFYLLCCRARCGSCRTGGPKKCRIWRRSTGFGW